VTRTAKTTAKADATMNMTRLLAGIAVALALLFAAARCDKDVYLGAAPFDAAADGGDAGAGD
jgi:hypothetical protein